MIRDGVYRQCSVGTDGNVLDIDEVKSTIYFICATQILILKSLFTLFLFALIAQLCTAVLFSILSLFVFCYVMSHLC